MKYVWEAKDITMGLVALNPETNLPAFIVGLDIDVREDLKPKRQIEVRRWRLTSLTDGHIYPARTAIELAKELTELGAKAAPGHHPDYYLELCRNTQETTRITRVKKLFSEIQQRKRTKTYGRPSQ